ncbi:hypothetical protein BDV96DRAFT_578166 [Lophiotrema nucula]|uniref:Uncharacterized protein n=1 Tax=Lophiotrema nucula TaxID=690887 RepID=A0A6A5Z3S2_9PLEO|nr:hypothetical protein BDV96DRAFT_578166 [Lophiotrema nucula]
MPPPHDDDSDDECPDYCKPGYGSPEPSGPYRRSYADVPLDDSAYWLNDDAEDGVDAPLDRAAAPSGFSNIFNWPQKKGASNDASTTDAASPEETPSSLQYGDNDDDDDDDNDDLPSWLKDAKKKQKKKKKKVKKAKKGKKKGKYGKKKCPKKCLGPKPTSTSTTAEPTETSTSSDWGYSYGDSTTTTTWDGYGSTTADAGETTTSSSEPAYTPDVYFTTTFITTTSTEDVYASSPTDNYDATTLGSICPPQCNPFNPLENKCGTGTSCVTDGAGKYYCACPGGMRLKDVSPKDFGKQFISPAMKNYVFVGPGEVCEQRCDDPGNVPYPCAEVPLRPQCA